MECHAQQKHLTRRTNFGIGSANRAEVSRWAHAVGAQPLPGLAVRHGIRGTKLAEVTRPALEVGFHQARGIACVTSGAQEAVGSVGEASDGVVRPVVAVISLE